MWSPAAVSNLDPAADRSAALMARTRLSFIMLAAYLLSQSYLIPIAAVGPWAAWPRLADLAFFGLFAAVLLGARSSHESTAAQGALLRSLLLIYALCWSSYGLMVLLRGDAVGIFDGLHNLARLSEFFLLYWLVLQIPLNARRLQILGGMVDVSFWVVCISIVLTYFEVIPLRILTAHLPQDPNIAGNWAHFSRWDQFDDVHKGVGTVSYTHAYSSILILLLLALRLHIFAGRSGLLAAVYVLTAIGATILTESRAGLAAVVVFAAIFALRNPKVLLGGLFLAFLAAALLDWRHIEHTLEHQKTIVSATSDDNLSGRPMIWANHIRSLTDHPWRVIFGGGFGSARVNGKGSDGHMLYLHILSEGGVIGLLLFGSLSFLVLSSLYRYDSPGRPLFWATLALLFSALTQESFYPLPSMGHFLGLYLVAVALALRRRENP